MLEIMKVPFSCCTLNETLGTSIASLMISRTQRTFELVRALDLIPDATLSDILPPLKLASEGRGPWQPDVVCYLSQKAHA